MAKTRIVILLAVLALLCKATARPEKAKPGPSCPAGWCTRSFPAKCGSWGGPDGAKCDCSGTCPDACTYKSDSGNPKNNKAGKCCTCKLDFESNDCVCGGSNPATATFCADQTCASCQAAVCSDVCVFNALNDADSTGIADIASPFTWPSDAYPDIGAALVGSSCPAGAKYNCECPDCQAAICADACAFNAANDETAADALPDIAFPFTWSAAAYPGIGAAVARYCPADTEYGCTC